MSGLEERANQYVDHSKDIYPVFSDDMSENIYGVNVDLWNDWSHRVKLLFNVTFATICEAGIEILDENTMPMPKAEFQTMAYNAAGLAAESLHVIEKFAPSQKLCACL